VKEQLTRLASADFRFGMGQDGRSVTIKGSVTDGFELWTPRNEKAGGVMAHDRPVFPPVFRESDFNPRMNPRIVAAFVSMIDSMISFPLLSRTATEIVA
jgi:hypothetical protein